MIGLSPRIREAVELFAASIELPTRPASDGSYSFILSHSGILSFTPTESGERLLVSLARSEPGPETENAWRLMQGAGFDAATNKFLHSGLDVDGNAIRVFEFSDSEVDLPTLDLAVRRLIEAQKP